jgi:hypothetical protein
MPALEHRVLLPWVQRGLAETLKQIVATEPCKIRTAEPKRFRLNPIHQMPGLLYSAG